MVRRIPCLACLAMVGPTEFCSRPECPIFDAYEYDSPSPEVSTAPVEGPKPVMGDEIEPFDPPPREVSTTPVVTRRHSPAVALTPDIFKEK